MEIFGVWLGFLQLEHRGRGGSGVVVCAVSRDVIHREWVQSTLAIAESFIPMHPNNLADRQVARSGLVAEFDHLHEFAFEVDR